jgi:hypothetical protein
MKTKISILFIFIYLSAYPDYVDDGNYQSYGRIIEISSTQITLAENCSTATIKVFPWTDNLIVYFSERCDRPAYTLSRSPISADLNCSKRKIFRFLIKSKQKVSYADEFYISNDILHITYARGKGKVIYSAKDIYKGIEWTMFSTMCENDIPLNFETL